VEKARIFISWSGDASRAVAVALRDWLPEMFQTVEPFVSSEDIAAGTLWFNTIGHELRRSSFAIICVTAENKDSPWLHFEAGAIGMAQGGEATPGNVVPYLLGLTTSSLKPPLSLYQAIEATEPDTRRLAVAINQRVPAPLSLATLDRTFERWWPGLDSALKTAAMVEQAEPEHPARTERDMLEELLAISRQTARHESVASRSDPFPSRDALTIAWVDHVVPRLKGMAKALFLAGRFVAVDDGAATFALPSATQVARCESYRPDVEAALADYFGRPVPLRLVIDDVR
jgi:hypothetical protein